jgi:methyl-accepting chemotaxis protein
MKSKFRSEYFLFALIITVSAAFMLSTTLWIKRLNKKGNELQQLVTQYKNKMVVFENKIDLYFFTGNYYYFENINNSTEKLNVLLEQLPMGGTFTYEDKTYEIEDYSIEESEAYKNLIASTERLLQSTANVEQNAAKNDAYNLGGTSFDQIDKIRYLEQASENLQEVKTALASVFVNIDKVQDVLKNKHERKEFVLKVTLYSIQVVVFAFLIFSYFYFRNKLFKPVRKVTSFAKNLSEGKTDEIDNNLKNTDLLELDNSLQKLSKHINDATSFAISIGEGKVDEQIEVNADDMLGKALLEMRDKLKEVAEEERKRNWAVNGMAKFSEIMRQHQHSELPELSYQFIFALVKYLEGNQGGVFLINEEQEDKFIELTACYAYERRKKMHARLEMEEGLIGQCVLEKDLLYIEEVPDDYINITSGLGKKTPTCILIAPIKVNEEIFGAVEIAFFDLLPQYKIDFVVSVCETFGSTLSSSHMNMRTRKLLEDSQAINSELQQKEEQMRQNAEELQATQEELNRKLAELGKETNLSKNIIEAINKTNATIEFDLEGNILNVNDMYLSVMGFTKDEILSKNESSLVPKDEMDSSRYQMLWESLRSGSFMSGEYRRLNKSGREVWLNGTYNPIFDVNGKPYKIIQFAQFTTEEKEKDLDLSSKINAISSTFPLIELELDGKIKSSNQEFINLFGYKRLEIRNKEFYQLIDDNSQDQTNCNIAMQEAKQATKTAVLGFKSKDGDLRYCLTICTPIRNLAGEVYKIMTILVDITEQKKLELELIQNQGILSTTIGELKLTKQNLLAQKNEIESRINMLDMAASIFEIDPEGNIININEHFCQTFVVEKNDLIGKSFYEFIDSNFDNSIVDKMWKNINEGLVVRNILPIKFHNKYWIDITVAPVWDAQKKPYKFMGLIYDVTTRVETETTLREDLAKERMRSTILSLKGINDEEDQIALSFSKLTSALDGNGNLEYDQLMNELPTISIDKTGIINRISDEAERVLDVKAKSLIGKTMYDLIIFDKKEEQQRFMKKLISGMVIKQSINIEINKNLIALDLISLPVFGEKPSDINILMFFNRRITEVS